MNKNYVDLPAPVLYVPEYKPLEWARKNCPSYITNDAVQRNGNYYYRFYFSDERDMIVFKLTWGSQ